MILLVAIDDRHKLLNLFIGNGNLHPLAAQHIRRPYQHRISQPVRHFLGLFGSVDRSARCSWNLGFFQYFIKKLPILCGVHILRLRAQNRHTHLHQAFRQLNGCLAAELHHSAVRFLYIYNILHIFRRQRLKVQFIRDIKIGTDRLRVIVDDDCFIARFGKGPGGMDGTIIKFNTLPDPDGSGA